MKASTIGMNPTNLPAGPPIMPNNKFGAKEEMDDVIFTIRIPSDIAKRYHTRLTGDPTKKAGMDTFARYLYERVVYKNIVDQVY
jgi:hypothetical protein